VATETRPIFFHCDGKLITSVLPDALIGFEDLERMPGLATLSETQVKAHDALQVLCQKNSTALAMHPGDLTFVNNFSILHAREEFFDTPTQKRYLVRMWLKNEDLAWKLPASLLLGNDIIFRDDSLEENWNITPEPRCQFQIYERQTP
jgi:hypothetical protein